MPPLTKAELNHTKTQKYAIFVEKESKTITITKTITYCKVRDHCHYTAKYRGAAHSICNLKFNVPDEIPVVFHNGSNYDYHLIIKKLAKEFEGKYEFLGENTEKYKTFSIPIEKEVTKTDKHGSKSVVTVSYKIKFINSARFMASSLSNLIDNLTEEFHKVKCKDCDRFLEYESAENNLIKYKSLSHNKDYSKKLDEKFKKRFKNTFKFSDQISKKLFCYLEKFFILMTTWMNGKSLRKQYYL